MILADKIIELRKKNGWSQEELAEKLDVSRQSISKWEGAQSVPDLSRIVRMAEIFGVSTDYLLKDEVEELVPAEYPEEQDAPVRRVTMEEANRFLALRQSNAARVALGVMMCILSPVPVILLAALYEFGNSAITETAAMGLGTAAMFLLIAGAVALFVTCGLRYKKYEYLEKEPVETLYGVSGMVKERREQFQRTFTRQLTLGIVLCVVSLVPLFVSLAVFGEAELPMLAATCAMLALIAVGVLLIVRSSMVWGSFQMLLEEGDYTREAKTARRAHGYIGGIYWGLVTAAYLAASFLTNKWDRTWIIWPVAAVAYGAIFGIVSALRRKDG